MSDAAKELIVLLNVQIGCLLRYERLKMRLSQQELGLEIGMDSTLIGRIERALNFSSWDKIYIYAQYVNLTPKELLSLKTRDDLLEIVEKSFILESKKSPSTKLYYQNLKSFIIHKFS